VYNEEIAPEMIVVCIQNNNRNRDMLPAESQYAPDGASNEKFFLFLSNEVIPFINSSYRTTDFKILCGQSLSGFFTLYTFIKKPGLFDAYIPISPSFADCKNSFFEIANNSEMTEDMKKALVHVSFGGNDRESDIGLSASHLLDILISKGKDRDDHFKWKLEKYEKEGHVPKPAFYDGLKWIFENMEE
ncbi:MAG: hypothetical protein JW833_06415, partial [Prolixibacteraceae bacterium]|nr:hypothetical protein [Prolixibacteraceae bacterium]